MNRYEVLMLAVPEITQDETTNLESELTKVIKKHKGSVIATDRWGKFRLAYPVRKNDYGVYFLTRFEVAEKPTELLEEIRSFFTIKAHDLVMRNHVQRLDSDASLEYQRPQSLEETPVEEHDVNTFLKKNKMEGLMSSVRDYGQDDDEGDDE